MQPSITTAFQTLTGTPFRVLVTVTDKTGLDRLRPLLDRGAEFVSTGGTAGTLRDKHGIPCTDVANVTGFKEMLDGRVKILDPHIFAGILADQSNPEHLRQLDEAEIAPFHLVVVNLYDFLERPGIGQIDVGGPSALRAAAKSGITVIVDPSDYERVIREVMASESGQPSLELRIDLATKVFRHTAEYDRLIAEWFEDQALADKNPFVSAGH